MKSFMQAKAYNPAIIVRGTNRQYAGVYTVAETRAERREKARAFGTCNLAAKREKRQEILVG
jgi:hypothetical protein